MLYLNTIKTGVTVENGVMGGERKKYAARHAFVFPMTTPHHAPCNSKSCTYISVPLSIYLASVKRNDCLQGRGNDTMALDDLQHPGHTLKLQAI